MRPDTDSSEESLRALDQLRASGRLRRTVVLAQTDEAFSLIGFGLTMPAVGELLELGYSALQEIAEEAHGKIEDVPDVPPERLRTAAVRMADGGPGLGTLAAGWAEFEQEVCAGLAKEARRTLRAVFYCGATLVVSQLAQLDAAAVLPRTEALLEEIR